MTVTATPELVSFSRRIGMHSAERPHETAIIFAPEQGAEELISWQELDWRSNQVARLLAEHGVDQGSTVVVAAGNRPEHYYVAYAAWKLGALLLTLRPALPGPERDAILDVAQPTVVVAGWEDARHPTLSLSEVARAEAYNADPLPDRISNPGKALASGGSTGRPKMIVRPGP